MILTRRSFGSLVAAGAASRLAPAAPFQDSGRKIGYCIVGLGRISMQHFMPATRMSQRSRVTAIVSGHRDKAEKWAADYGVPARSIYSYENYDAIAQNQDIDAVYIALPNSMHAEYSIRAAKAGKHVLSEKPMATTVADAQAMVDACRKANKKLMIAYRCQYEGTNLRAIQLIRDGKLGKLESIESSNGFNIRAGEWRLSGKLAGGGPLMDMGIYSLNACRYPTGEEPVEVKGYSSVIDKDGRFNEVEENLLDHAFSLRRGRDLQHQLRRQPAGLLSRPRLERDDACGASVRLRRAASHREYQWRAAHRRTESGERSGAISARGRSPGQLHSGK